MTITQILDQYCIARSRGDVASQVEIANRIVDEVIPAMIVALPRQSAYIGADIVTEDKAACG